MTSKKIGCERCNSHSLSKEREFPMPPSPFIISHPVNQDNTRNALEQRIAELNPRLTKTAHYLAVRTGEDREDVMGEMLAAICQKATQTPGFLTQKDAFIVQKAAWAALNAARRGWEHDSYQTFLNELELDDLPAPEADVYCSDFASLPTELRELAQAIIMAGDDILTVSTRKLNMSKLADRVGKPKSTVSRHVKQIAAWLGSQKPELALAASLITKEQFKHLRGKAITVGKAAKKYWVLDQTIRSWIACEYIVLLPGYGTMKLDEADMAYCAAVYHDLKHRRKKRRAKVEEESLAHPIRMVSALTI